MSSWKATIYAGHGSAKMRPDWAGRLAVALLLLLIGIALGAPLLFPDPLTQRLDRALLRPGSSGHLLGTDHLGRDVASRIAHGARSSLMAAIGSATIAFSGGMMLGLLDAAGPKPLRVTLGVLADATLAFPTILLAMTLALVFGRGIGQLSATLGVIYIPVVYRVVRSQARSVTQHDYYRISGALGTGPLGRIVLHLVPHAAPHALVQAAGLAALAIGTEAALSFLGMGAQPPEPSWGLLLSDARRYLGQAPYLSIAPGVAVIAATFSFQYSSDRLAAWIRRYDDG